jgi:hypothetical protein
MSSAIQVTDDLKALYIKTAQVFRGSEKRQFMAGVVKGLGVGGQVYAVLNSPQLLPAIA